MRLLRGVAAAAVMVMMLGACGESAADREAREAAASASTEAEASASAEAEAKAKAKKERAEERAKQEQVWAACDRGVEDLRDELSEIDSRLSIGLSYADFSDRVGDAQVAYDRAPWKRLNDKCTWVAGIPLEVSLNHYIRAYNAWQRCIEDFTCEVEGDVLKNLRRLWGNAGKALGKAERALRTPATYDRAESLF